MERGKQEIFTLHVVKYIARNGVWRMGSNDCVAALVFTAVFRPVHQRRIVSGSY